MVSMSIPSAQDVTKYVETLSNWGRWGPNDELGTLNYITPEKRIAAARLVRKSVSVGCSRIVQPESASDVRLSPLHFMQGTAESAPAQGGRFSSDFIGLVFHGLTITHIDAFSHMVFNRKSYNGLDASAVTADGKATKGGIQVLEHGVVTRGVLLDIAKAKGVQWMSPGEGIFPEDLEAAEKAQGVRVEAGDALLYRTGWAKAREVQGPPPNPDRPGLHAACLPWLHKRQVALIASDAATDVAPNGYGSALPFDLPIHAIAICAMGLWILDSCSFEALAAVCNRENRWDFQFVVAPLRWKNATGSPINPIAIF